jgi:hypothetical protein
LRGKRRREDQPRGHVTFVLLCDECYIHPSGALPANHAGVGRQRALRRLKALRSAAGHSRGRHTLEPP